MTYKHVLTDTQFTADQWLKYIVHCIMAGQNNRLKVLLGEIHKSVDEITKKRGQGFFADGVYYPGELKAPKGSRTMLPMQLQGDFNDFYKEKLDTNLQEGLISGVMHKLLYPCNSLQEVRDTIPDCVANVCDKLKVPRVMLRPAFTLGSDERSMRQYEKILPKIEFYCALQLIY